MAKKTTLRRGSKWIKLSPEQREVIEKDDDQFPIHEPLGVGRDTGAELERRMNLIPDAAQDTQAGTQASGPVNATPEGLSGARLALWEKVAEMAAGDALEMGKVLSNLSGGKIAGRDGLIAAEDALVQDVITKITGGKK